VRQRTGRTGPRLPRYGFAPVKSNIRPIRSYVLRQGRMSDAQRRAFGHLFPKYGIAYRPAPLDLDAAFGRRAPRILEIGSGMGETTAQMAQSHPDRDYLAVEVHAPGVGSLLRRVEALELKNVRVIRHDAVEVVRDMIPESTLAGVHLFFPDPWPKKRHHKRRLLQPAFAHELSRCLAPGGYLHVATDWRDYAEQTLATLAAETLLENTADGFAPRPAYRPLTKFETRGIQLGHGVWDLVFRRCDGS
jgi:tRNA (guanine-N7-)-methyltransferase